MLCMLVAYDAAGNVVATLDHMVARDAEGNVTGLIDFAAYEAAGGKLRDIWTVDSAVGSATWPEWLGVQAHDFRVELDTDKRIVSLIHKRHGLKRRRDALEAAVMDVEPREDGARDIRHLVGGPGAPLLLDGSGRTVGRSAVEGTPDHLPILKG